MIGDQLRRVLISTIGQLGMLVNIHDATRPPSGVTFTTAASTGLPAGASAPAVHSTTESAIRTPAGRR